VIELINVTRVYPMGVTEVRALNGVNLRIDAGEFVAIVGPSGSGKSTMMHVIGCLDRPTSGEYRLQGQRVSALGDRQLARVRNQKIGFVFQTFNLVSRARAWENVALPLLYARQARTKADALEALERVNLAARADHAPNELSGGERQRVAIARAIVNRPALILADEPTGNLDTRTGDQIMAIFHRLHRGGATIVLVTHEPDIAAQADRIVTMRDGLIIDDRPNTQKRRPQDADAGADDADACPPGGVATARGAAERAALSRPADDYLALPAASATRARSLLEVAPWPSTRESVEEVSEAGGAIVDREMLEPVDLHPQAVKAVRWACAGPLCLAGIVLIRLGQTSLELKRGFFAVLSSVAVLALMVAAVVAPVVGVIHGRRAARWIRLAPRRFGGLGRARAAFWGSMAQLLLMAALLGLLVLNVIWAVRTGQLRVG